MAGCMPYLCDSAMPSPSTAQSSFEEKLGGQLDKLKGWVLHEVHREVDALRTAAVGTAAYQFEPTIGPSGELAVAISYQGREKPLLSEHLPALSSSSGYESREHSSTTPREDTTRSRHSETDIAHEDPDIQQVKKKNPNISPMHSDHIQLLDRIDESGDQMMAAELSDVGSDWSKYDLNKHKFTPVNAWRHITRQLIIEKYEQFEEDDNPHYGEPFMKEPELHPTWEQVKHKKESLRRNTSKVAVKASTDSGTSTVTTFERHFYSNFPRTMACMQSCVIHPESKRSALWTVIGGCFVMMDIILAPLVLMFKLDTEDWFTSLAWVIATFWSLDIVMQFMTGYFHRSMVELSLPRIARQYIKGWFPLDVFVNILDWTMLILSVVLGSMSSSRTGSWAARAGKLWRLGRVLRLLRLSRIIKLASTFNLSMSLKSFHSQYLILIARLARLVFCIILLAHYIACVWLWLAISNEEEMNWLRHLGIEDASNAGKYVWSLHWSLTQFTPSTNNIAPVRTEERLAAIFIILMSMMLFSSFISSVTSAMNQLRTLNAGRNEEEAKIRAFLGDNPISKTLEGVIWNFFWTEHTQASSKKEMKDITFFDCLPVHAKQQLLVEIYSPKLAWHPVFNLAWTLDEAWARTLCCYTFIERYFKVGQDVFNEGAIGTAMLFVQGTFQYKAAALDISVELKFGDWLCEGPLWTVWITCGRLKACAANSRLFELSAKEFHRLVMDNLDCEIIARLRRYAAFYQLMVIKTIHTESFRTDLAAAPKDITFLMDRAFRSTSLLLG